VAKRKKDGGLFILKAVCLLGRQSEEREAVVLEAVRWRHTSHPRLLQMSSVVEEPGFVYTLYEHADGRDLFSTMWSQNNMAEHSVKAIISAVLSAVGYCHKKGIVHGNIDPRNVRTLLPRTCELSGAHVLVRCVS
jgi:serine/threonine protein kinase